MVMNYQQNGCVPMSNPWSVITELHKAKFLYRAKHRDTSFYTVNGDCENVEY